MDAYTSTDTLAPPTTPRIEMSDHKAVLRQQAVRRRRLLAARLPHAGRSILRSFLQTPALVSTVGKIESFAGYWPIRSEVDARPMMRHLLAMGLTGALPVVLAKGRPLRFRRWATGDPLEEGAFGVPTPIAKSATIRPELVLVPLLAYDREGNRLGYGAGYYDRTLAALRRAGEVLCVGLAFAGQRIDRIPVEPDDEPLDWIVTEHNATKRQ